MSQPAEKLAEASTADWPFDEWGTARPDLNFVREYYLSDLGLCDKLLDLFKTARDLGHDPPVGARLARALGRAPGSRGKSGQGPGGESLLPPGPWSSIRNSPYTRVPSGVAARARGVSVNKVMMFNGVPPKVLSC